MDIKYITLLYLSIFFVSNATFGQEYQPSGLYTDKDDWLFVEIRNDTLTYSMRPYRYGSKEILSECKLKHVKDDFYEITSLEFDLDKLFGSMKIDNFSSNMESDSTIVIFDIPQCNDRGIEIVLTCSCCYGKKYTLLYNNSGDSVSIPKRWDKEISFKIYPPSYYIRPQSIDFDGRYLGIQVMLVPMFLDIEPDINRVYISIPDFSPDIFERYCIVHEYIWITDKEIKFKGKTFFRTPDNSKIP